MSDNLTGAEQSAGETFPVAEVKASSTGLRETVRASRLWLLTLACLLAAIGLTWTSIVASGPRIVIKFDQGHGIKPGDAIRHRGIEVGQVTHVELNADLSGIRVQVTLNEASAGLAREGSRFWIVRPQLSLAGVSGLETAIGAKYIAVDPGDPAGNKQRQFDGLPTPPPGGFEHDGVEVLLRGQEKHGIGIGAPVTYRGVDVGQILSVDLAPDSLSVDFRARIDADYASLLQPHSKFWVTSGFGFDMGLTGFHMNAESLSSVARGGVSFITPAISDADSSEAQPVAAGDIFVLHEQADKDWFKPAGVSTAATLRRWLRRDGSTGDKDGSATLADPPQRQLKPGN